VPVNTAFTAAMLAVRLERILDGRQVDVILRTPNSVRQVIDEEAERDGVML
jgi:hypothetical protein